MRRGEIKTVGDLRAALAEFGDGAPIAFAYQPNHPFEVSIGQVVAVSTGGAEKVYLAEVGESDYLPSEASEELGWS